MIPKILHRIRLGTDTLPPEAAEYERLWKQLHPEWEHLTWTMANLPPLINRELFDLSDNTGHRSDVLRLEIIQRFGGVYVDLDVHPQKPLDPLLDCDGFLGRIPPTKRKTCMQRVETAVIAAAPGNSFIGALVQNMPRWALEHRSYNTSVRTGPQFVQNQIDLWTGEFPITLYPASYFYPYLWSQPHRSMESFRDAYAIHRWWGTWRRQPQDLRPFGAPREGTPVV